MSFISTPSSALTSPTTIPGEATVGAQLRLNEASNNGTNYVGLKSPNSVASDLVFQLPGTDGTNGQVLQTNGAGVLSFGSAAAYAGARRAWFLTTSQTFTIPYTGKYRITAMGAGGGGGSAYQDRSGTYSVAASGGAGGGSAVAERDLTANNTLAIVIGTGGTGGTSRLSINTANGTAGGNTTVTSASPSFTLTGNGGAGGVGAVGTSAPVTASAATGGTGTGGDSSYSGGDGGAASCTGLGSAAATGGGGCSIISNGFASGTATAGTTNSAASGGTGTGGGSANAAANQFTPGGGSGGPSTTVAAGPAAVTYNPVSTNKYTDFLFGVMPSTPLMFNGAGSVDSNGPSAGITGDPVTLTLGPLLGNALGAGGVAVNDLAGADIRGTPFGSTGAFAKHNDANANNWAPTPQTSFGVGGSAVAVLNNSATVTRKATNGSPGAVLIEYLG